MNIIYLYTKIIAQDKQNYICQINNNSAISIYLLTNLKIYLNNKYKFYIYIYFSNSKNIEIKYFAFISLKDLNYFKNLIKIKGIGIKYAIEIFNIYLENNLSESSLEKYLKINKKLPSSILKIFS